MKTKVKNREGIEISKVSAVCTAIVDRYRSGAAKGKTIFELTKAISTKQTEDAESAGKTLEPYIAALDDWDRERTISDAKKRRRSGPERVGSTSAGARVPAPKPDDYPTGESDNEKPDEPAPKRPKIDPNQFAWTIRDRAEGIKLRAECDATRKLIANYSVDVKRTKADLLNSGFAPEFPDAEWKNVLLGLPVNLDAIHSGHYSITQEVGDFTISTREVATTKSINSSGDWFIAWNQAAAAIKFAFPHLSKHCDEYGMHILGLFAAIAEEHHAVVLNYDKAVRKRVGQRRDLLLTDLADFADIRVQFFGI